MGMWYKRSEAQKRFSFFFSSTTLAGAFGGLLAYGFGQMGGDRGYSGWRWVFIIEGVITCVVSFAWFFLLPDFPEDVKWMNDDEREFIRAKLAKDVGKSAHHIPLGWREVLATFKDCEWADWLYFRVMLIFSVDKIFIGGFMYFGLIVPAYGYAYFAPQIIEGYGYSGMYESILFKQSPFS